MTIWHQGAEVLENEVAEAAVAVERAVAPNDTVEVYALPQTQVASVMHRSNFAEFVRAHTILLKWIEESNYRITGPYHEIYIKHDPANLSDTVTEVQYPVERP